MEVVMTENHKISKERMGEIALIILTHRMAKELPTSESLEREVPNQAKKLGIDPAEAKLFASSILEEAVRIRLDCESVLITWKRWQPGGSGV